jgi:hypothetical protein
MYSSVRTTEGLRGTRVQRRKEREQEESELTREWKREREREQTERERERERERDVLVRPPHLGFVLQTRRQCRRHRQDGETNRDEEKQEKRKGERTKKIVRIGEEGRERLERDFAVLCIMFAPCIALV